jgi:(1->4)-alpha-D-glucan 1-alpha-D-glucosylmutase
MKKELEGNAPAKRVKCGLIPENAQRLKLFYTWTLLRFRRRHKELFVGGEYLPVEVRGRRARNVVAFIRKRGKKIALLAAGRFFTQWPIGKSSKFSADFWENTELIWPKGLELPATLRDVATSDIVESVKRRQGSAIRASDLFRQACACLLTNAEAEG